MIKIREECKVKNQTGIIGEESTNNSDAEEFSRSFSYVATKKHISVSKSPKSV